MDFKQFSEGRREDDEYHSPSKHHVQVTISKGDGPKEYRKATITAKEPSHAVNTALKHYKSQGYTVHDHKYLGENVNLDEKITLVHGKPPRDSGKYTANNQTRTDKTDAGGTIHGGTVYTGKDKPASKPSPAPAKKPSVLDRVRSSMKEEVDSLDEESHLSMAKNAKSEEEFHSHMLNHHMELMHAHKALGDSYASEHHADKAKHHADKLSGMGDKVKFDEGTGSLKPGWMLKQDPALAKKIKDQKDRKKFVAGEPTKKEVKEDMEESHAPVAPTLDRKYIKGTPEHKAYKATKKPINGHPTNNVKEENMAQQSFKGFLTSLTELTDKQKKHIDKNKNGKIDGHDFKLLRKEDSKCCESCGMEEAKCECDEMKEETINEANHREFAQQGKMHPDMAKHMKTGQEMDFYHSKTGDKISGVVKKNDGKEVHVMANKDGKMGGGGIHKFKVSSKLDEAKAEDPPFDGPYKKVTGDGNVKDKSGAVHTPMSRVRDLARKAMQKKMKEDFNLEITEEQAAELCDLAIINEKMDIAKADMGDVIKDFQKSDAPQFAGKSKEKRREMAIAAKMQSEDTVKSYKEFVTEIKMADLPSRKVTGTSYGAQYHDPEGDDDADTKKPKKASDAPKRGRGRPAGSKSGAKQQGSENKSNYGGIDRTTYALHLPRK